VQDAVDFARFDEAPLEIPVILRGELAAEELTQGDAVVVTGVLRVSSFLKSSPPYSRFTSRPSMFQGT
jgi:hypothetical protein